MKQKILTSLFGRLFRKITVLLDRRQKRKGIFVMASIVLEALLDVAGLAAILPLVAMATDPSLIQKNAALNNVYALLGFQSTTAFLVFASAILLFLFLIKNSAMLYFSYYRIRFVYDMATDLTQKQFRGYYREPLLFFKEHNSARLISDTYNVPTFFASFLVLPAMAFLSELVVVLLIIGGILLYDSLLFLSLAATLGPVFFLLYAKTRKRLSELGALGNQMRPRAYQAAWEAIHGYPDIKLSGRSAFFLKKVINPLRIVHQTQRQAQVYGLIPRRIIEMVTIFGVVLIFVYATVLSKGTTDLLLFLSIYAIAAYRAMPSVNRMLQHLMTMRGNIYTLDILVAPPQAKTGESPPQTITFDHAVELRHVSFSYPGSTVPVLENFSLTIQKGEVLGVVGTSGAGKTTLANLILRFLIEHDGGLFVDGKKIEQADTPAWWALIGYVKQDTFLLDASLKENIALGQHPDEIDEEALASAIQRARLERFAAALPEGVETVVGEMGDKISGGQRQRIGIARALYKDAELLIFDEATSALDLQTEREIVNTIEELAGTGKTIFIISHRKSALRCCHRIVALGHEAQLSETVEHR